MTEGSAALRTLGDVNTTVITTNEYIFGTTFYATIHSNLEQENLSIDGQAIRTQMCLALI